MHEKASDNISQVFLCGEQPEPNVDEGYTLLIYVLRLHCLMILFLVMLPSPEVKVNFSHVP